MKLTPSQATLEHLAQSLIEIPADGFLISDEAYKEAESAMRAAHPDEAEDALKDRLDLYLIWTFYGKKAAGDTGGVELNTQTRIAAASRQLVALADTHIPQLGEKISQAVEDSSKVIHNALATGHAKVESAILDLKRFEGESHAEMLRVKTEFYDSILTLAQRAWKFTAGAFGAVIILLAVLAVFAVSAHCQLDGLQVSQGGVGQKRYSAGYPNLNFTGSATVSCVGMTCTVNTSATGSSATFQVGGVNTTSQTVINFTAGSNLGVSNPSAGQVTYAFTGQLPVTKTAAAGQPLLSYDSTTGAFTQAALTAANVGLGSVTNDAQTKAAVVPNTAPSAGQMLIGNAGGTAYAPLSLSQDCTIASTGAITCTKTNNVAFGGGATMSTTAGGDLSGTLPSPTVAKVNGIAYSATAAAHSVEVVTTANTTATAKVIPDCTDATGNHLNYTQSTDAFSCGTSDSHVGTVTSVSGTANEIASTGGATPVLSIAPTFDIHGKTSTAPIKAGTTAAAPATCQANIELYIKTDATAGQQVFICNGTGNGWNLVGDGGGAGSSPGGSNTQVQFNDSTAFGGAVGLTYNKTTQTTTFTGVGAAGAAINIASQTAVTTPNAGDIWIDTSEEKHVVTTATSGAFKLYDTSGNARTDDTTGTVTSYTVHHPTAAPTYAAHEQTDTCGSSTCTQTWHMDPVVMMVGTSDFVTAANTNLQLITGLSFTFPANVAQKASIDCYLLYNQQTAAVADAFGIQDVTVAPTNINASAFVQTAATTIGYANLAALASTTATNIITMTPSAITTVWQAQLHIMVEHPSNASSSVLQIMAKTGTAADTLTVKRGSYCTANFQ